MKKTKLLFLILFLTKLSYAQWSNGTNVYNTNTGNIGIGISNPQFKLHVIGDIGIDQPHALIFANGQSIRDNGGGGLTISSGYSISNYLGGTGAGTYTILGGNVGVGTTSPTSLMTLQNSSAELHVKNDATNALTFGGFDGKRHYIKSINLGIALTPLTLQASEFTFDTGNVGIGTTAPDQKLTVNGTIHSTQVKVDLNIPGPDYVFKKNYPLPELSDVKNYIDKNHHLSEIPSAVQMAKNGVNLGDLNIKLLKKVEELTLYLVEEHNKNQRQEKEITDLKQQFVTFKKQSRIMK